MRKRYVTASTKRPRLYDYLGEPVQLAGFTVFEPEPMLIDTGLLDESGFPIRFQEVMAPIGFVHHQEE